MKQLVRRIKALKKAFQASNRRRFLASRLFMIRGKGVECRGIYGVDFGGSEFLEVVKSA
jgi:hypothetical protein